MPWYDERAKNLANEKKIAFLAYKSLRTPERKKEYVRIRNRVYQEKEKMIKEYWEKINQRCGVRPIWILK